MYAYTYAAMTVPSQYKTMERSCTNKKLLLLFFLVVRVLIVHKTDSTRFLQTNTSVAKMDGTHRIKEHVLKILVNTQRVRVLPMAFL